MSRYRLHESRKLQLGLEAAHEAVSEKIWDAMIKADERLRELSVPHVLIGGVAVGAHGRPRTTTDVDFLVGDEAWKKSSGGIISPIAGLPIAVGDVGIDDVPIANHERFLEEVFEEGQALDDVVPVAPGPVLVYLKLSLGRSKDIGDLVELVKVRDDKFVADAAEYLAAHAPANLLEKWYELVEHARNEVA